MGIPDLVLLEEGEKEAILVSDYLDVVLKKPQRGLLMYKRELGEVLSEKELIELKRGEARALYEEVSEAVGQSFFHCFYLAFKYQEGFFDGVQAYSVRSVPGQYQCKLSVAFYGVNRRPN